MIRSVPVIVSIFLVPLLLLLMSCDGDDRGNRVVVPVAAADADSSQQKQEGPDMTFDVNVDVDIYNLDVTDRYTGNIKKGTKGKKDDKKKRKKKKSDNFNDNYEASTIRHEVLVDKHFCRDSFHFDCEAVLTNGDCDTHSKTDPNSLIGDVYCPASCGRCRNDIDINNNYDISENLLRADKLCYTFARQQINITFTNADPQREDWIGVYPHDVDVTDLGSPVAWYWLCDSNKRDKCKARSGIVTFPWLPPGIYKAVLSRNPKDGKGPYAAFGPFSAYTESESFEVVRSSEGCSMRKRRRRMTSIGSQVDHSTIRLLRGSST